MPHRSTQWRSILIAAAMLARPALGQTAVAAAGPAPGAHPHRVVLEGQVGLAAPLGALGLALDVDILPWLSVQAGAGVDVSDQDELCGCRWGTRQLALMPRLRHPVLGAGTFVSLGVGISRDAAPNVGEVHTPLSREDNEVSIEHRFDDGVRVRAFAGLGFYLNAPHLPAFGGVSVYYGAALGYAVWPNPPAPPGRSLSIGRWYGWQILLFDATAALLAASVHNETQAYRDEIALYAIPGPVIHFAHQRYWRVAVSVALRALVPLALASWAQSQPNPGGGESGPDPRAFAVAGAVVAALIDDLAVAWSPASP